MIIQLLGVALISLLTITPTIQQNNIEQLIVPNIETQPMSFNVPISKRLYQIESYAYYNSFQSTSEVITAENFNPNNLNITYNEWQIGTNFRTYATNIGSSTPTILINNNNFYVYDQVNSTTDSNLNITAEAMRLLLREYYYKVKGTTISSELFSFTVNSSNITSTSTFYTYSINGNGGLLEGRLYTRNINSFGQTNGSKLTNTITLSQGFTLQNIVEELVPDSTIELSTTADHKIWYYFLTVALTDSIGQQTSTLYARTNYGRLINYGTFTVNVTEADTTPPVINSITGNSINWTNQNITLTINATDETLLSGLNTPSYSFDNGTTYQFSNQKTFTTNEIVNIRVRDLAGNFTNQQVIINRIDKQSPAVTLPQGWVSSYEVNTITAQQLLATYNISDNQSGVNTSLTTIFNFNPTVIGAYNPLISVTDNAGNTFNYTSPTVNITQLADSIGPVITGPTSLTYQLGTITVNSIIQQYIISDISGIEPNSISIRNTSNQVITNLNLAIGTYSLRIYARDTLQNETNYPITLIVQDTVAPVITGNTVQQLVVNRTQQDLIARFSIFDDSDITVQIIGNINYGLPGNYSVTLRATDSVGNITNLSIIVNITLPDTTGPLISGAFGISVEVGLFNDNQQFINQYFTITDPSGIKSTVLTGTLDFNVVGSYNVVLVATDNQDNVSNRQLTIKVYDPINLADYNPLTDLFSGIFGGLLSMIFTIGTINLLGFRLLDAMALIILGSVIWLVYKAIKGGS
jgi:hypothetical protein